MLNYGGWDDTMTALSAMGQDRRHVWLIDNASPQDRSAMIAAAFPEVRIITMERNWGWAGAYNRAIALASAEGHPAVYILNNDAVPHPDAVASALESLFSDSLIAAVGSLMLQHGGQSVFFDGDWYFHGGGLPVAQAHHDLRLVRSLHGGGFALKLAAYTDVGPFHEDYFLYHEETDWCFRAQAKGWTIAIDGRSRVDHEGGASNLGFNSSYYMARNRYLAMRRNILLRDRQETRLSIAEYEYIGSLGAPLSQRVAITSGLIDGWRGKFGQRATGWSPVITLPLAIMMPIWFRMVRRFRHLSGTRA